MVVSVSACLKAEAYAGGPGEMQGLEWIIGLAE